MKKMANETKIGIMVVVCIVALIALSFKVGNFSFYKKRYDIKLQFNNAGGINLHATVRIAGVEVGEITEIDPPTAKNDYKVFLTAALDEHIKVPKDAIIYITMLGVMGDKYVEITSGTKEAGFLKPGDTIIGKDPIIMEKVYENIDEGIKELKGLSTNVNDIVVDNRTHIDSTLANIDNASNNLDEFSADIKANPWKLLFRSKEKKKDEQN